MNQLGDQDENDLSFITTSDSYDYVKSLHMGQPKIRFNKEFK